VQCPRATRTMLTVYCRSGYVSFNRLPSTGYSGLYHLIYWLFGTLSFNLLTMRDSFI
jgi:hypothetical protein